MKLALIDTANSGHHIVYRNCLVTAASEIGNTVIQVGPVSTSDAGNTERKQKLIELQFPKKKNLFQFWKDRRKWLYSVIKLTNLISPNIVHFLTGDSIYQLGGFQLSNLRAQGAKIVLTQHHMPKGRMRTHLFWATLSQVDTVVVHSESNRGFLRNIGIDENKIFLIDYPVFHDSYVNNSEAKESLDLKLKVPILLALGGTRTDKGLDVLLESLALVHEPFHLVIAGKEEHFDREFIEERIQRYAASVTLRLGYLSDEEFGQYVDAADCVVLPYRKSFDGASGPMTEAIWRRKPVIGPNHGSIGYLIKKYGLGYTFEAENVVDLANTITKYLKNPGGFRWSDQAETYREWLNPDTFAKKYMELYERLLNTKHGAE